MFALMPSPLKSAAGVNAPAAAKLLRWAGYATCFILGAVLWPRLMELGFAFRNSNFGLAILFNWLCLPVSMLITSAIGMVIMRLASLLEDAPDRARTRKAVSTASMLGIMSSLASCTMIASGYEPPEPLYSIYDLTIWKF